MVIFFFCPETKCRHDSAFSPAQHTDCSHKTDPELIKVHPSLKKWWACGSKSYTFCQRFWSSSDVNRRNPHVIHEETEADISEAFLGSRSKWTNQEKNPVSLTTGFMLVFMVTCLVRLSIRDQTLPKRQLCFSTQPLIALTKALDHRLANSGPRARSFSTCLCKWSVIGTQPHPFVSLVCVAAFVHQQQSRGLAEETFCPAKPKVFTLRGFTEEVCWLLV